jgi:predicted nucleotide-binding protein (sugar kinase/HSP70/actin superfamily)
MKRKPVCFVDKEWMEYHHGYCDGMFTYPDEVPDFRKEDWVPLYTPPDVDWPESEEFYNLMQAYRHTRMEDQKAVVDAYEAVKEYLRGLY